MQNEIIPASIEKAQQPTWVVAFGAAVHDGVANGVDSIDYEWAAREAEDWTYSDAYRAGFAAGADWYATLRP
jgi:hypothetical protein